MLTVQLELRSGVHCTVHFTTILPTSFHLVNDMNDGANRKLNHEEFFKRKVWLERLRRR